MLDVEYVKAAVRKLAYFDMEYKGFGSWGHAHIFKPVLEEEQLATWEELMQLRLPEDFRLYLTKLGNGGAGPAYGIAPFHLPRDKQLNEISLYSDEQAEAFNETAQAWFEMSNVDEEDCYERYKLENPQEAGLSFREWEDKFYEPYYDKLEQKLMSNGQLFIANQGCSVDIYLILNGTERGMCHSTNTDYDYSYPCTREQDRQFHLLPEPRPARAVIWNEYKESLMDFEKYLINYVVSGLERIEGFSAEQRQQFKRERQQVLEFDKSVQEQDLMGIEKLIGKLDPLSFSFKTRSYFLESMETLSKEFPNNGLFQKFLHQIKYKPNKTWTYDSVVFAHRSRNNIDYPHPTFDEFKSTFHKSFLNY